MGNERYLKWQNTVVGIINENSSVDFINPKLNTVVYSYTLGKSEWSADQYREFLKDRVIAKTRRDIDKILYRSGLIEYDEIKIANVTRAVNAKDLFWIAFNESETMEDIMSGVFEQIFIKKVDFEGGSIVSPDGVNIKRYGVSNGCYGIYKKRLYPTSTDVESEAAVYELSKLLGVRCCPAWLVPTENEILSFSKFEYNFATEFVIHFRRLFLEQERKDNEYFNLINKTPQFKADIQRMIIIDFITRQTDRHLSNIAIKVTDQGNFMYDLYDNGRSLFHEDTDEFIFKAIDNIELYSSEFGPVGTYYDAICEIIKDTDINSLVNLNIPEQDIGRIYSSAGLRGARLDGAVAWTFRTINMLKSW